MRKSNGFTLIEVIVATALTTIVLLAVGSVLVFGSTIHRKTAVEVETQSQIRLVADRVNKTTRYATSTHTVPKSSFQVAGVRDESWSYLGVDAAGNVVLDEPGATPTDPRKVTVLAPVQNGISYGLEYKRVINAGLESDSLVGVIIVGYRDGIEISRIDTGIEILNSNQVDHNSSDLDPGVALAFSTAPVGSAEFISVTPDAYVTIVLDLSGSMQWAMGGQYSSGRKRYLILIDRATKMVNDFSKMGFDIYVSIVRFGTDANDYTTFRNVNIKNASNQLSSVLSYISNLRPYSGSDAGTNTGDGLRRGYYQLKKKSDEVMLADPSLNSKDFTRHMLVLVDGGTNADTYFRNPFVSGGWFPYDGDKPVGEYTSYMGYSQLIRTYYDENGTDGDDFVDHIGTELIKKYQHDGEQIIQCSVVGFSARTADHVSLNSIGGAINAHEYLQPDGSMKRYVLATNEDELEVAFGTFVQEVASSLWSIYGPRLR